MAEAEDQSVNGDGWHGVEDLGLPGRLLKWNDRPVSQALKGNRTGRLAWSAGRGAGEGLA
jgi:hypothetical protein